MRKHRVMLMVLLTVQLVGSLFAQQPGDYGFRFGAVVQDGDMDIVDLHYLGRNRETGRDEFLALLRTTPREGRPDPLYFVHFSYGGTPPKLEVLNVRIFRPRIVNDLGTPPAIHHARLIYQPQVVADDPRLSEPPYWYLIVWPGFIYRLKADFYKAPADSSIIIDGKWYSPAFQPYLGVGHFGVVWRPRGILNTPSVSSILIGWVRPLSGLAFLSVDRQGNILGSWEYPVPSIFCETPPCQPPCGLPTSRVLAFDFGWGGSSNITGLTPAPGTSVDEYAAAFKYILGEQPNNPLAVIPVAMRFDTSGRVRWARLYRMFKTDGSPTPDITYTPFWIVEDRSSPTASPNRLIFATGYGHGELWRVNRETGDPVSGLYLPQPSVGGFGEAIRPGPDGTWVISGDSSIATSYVVRLNDDNSSPYPGLQFTGEYNTGGSGTQCWDYGDKYWLGIIGGDYLIAADDGNVALGDCQNGAIFLPYILFTRRGENYPCGGDPGTPQIERGRLCSWEVGVTPRPLSVGVQRATADVDVGRMPVTVVCRVEVGFDLCTGSTHCTNGVGWGDGDVSPYPTDPFGADLSDFGDCCVDDDDLLAVLFAFGSEYDYGNPGQFKPGPGDVNCDGIVDDDDLLIVLFHFGEGCL